MGYLSSLFHKQVLVLEVTFWAGFLVNPSL